jgi:hypothetical protein
VSNIECLLAAVKVAKLGVQAKINSFFVEVFNDVEGFRFEKVSPFIGEVWQ